MCLSSTDTATLTTVTDPAMDIRHMAEITAIITIHTVTMVVTIATRTTVCMTEVILMMTLRSKIS